MPLRRCKSLRGSTGASPYVGVWRMRATLPVQNNTSRPPASGFTKPKCSLRAGLSSLSSPWHGPAPLAGLFYKPSQPHARLGRSSPLEKADPAQSARCSAAGASSARHSSVNRGTGSYDQRNKWATAVLALRGLPAMEEFVFKVSLRAVVRVRAADESVARNVVPTVLGAPGSTEIALANQNNVLVGRDATVTGVEFSMVGSIKSSKS